MEFGMYKSLETEVLVIGGGGAGCRAAIEAHDNAMKLITYNIEINTQIFV